MGIKRIWDKFYLPTGAELVEYGFLIHDDNTLDLTLDTLGYD